MADIDFSALIEQGVETWNQWRSAHPEARPDLSRAYLYGQALNGFDLSHVNFERACLIGANLNGANLSGACLASVYASNSNFSQANLTGADLRQGSFAEADFSEADLSAANVQGTEFAGADFTGACFAALRADHTTSFGGTQGQHLYVKLPPAGRFPQAGDFQAGELAAFLQQRFAPATVQLPTGSASVVTTVPKLAIADQLRGSVGAIAQTIAKRSLLLSAATVETSGLFLDWLIKVVGRLRQRLVAWGRQCHRFLLTELIPTVRRYWGATRRLMRYLYLRSRRKSRRLGHQLWQRGGVIFRLLRWYGKRQWRRLHRWTLRTYCQIRKYLQQDFWPACIQFLTGVLRFCRYWRILIWRALTRSLVRRSNQGQTEFLKLRTLLRSWWADFVKGERSFQHRIATGHQALRSEFEQMSDRLQMLAFRQTERFYAAGLVGERYVKLAIASASEQLQQSRYLQSVTSDLRKEYRRYPLPLAVGFAGAIALMLLNPATRSERSDSVVSLPPIDASTVDAAVESVNGASAAQGENPTESDLDNGLRNPESVEASMADSTDIALSTRRPPESSPVRFNQVAASGIDSIALPCPASSVDLSKSLSGYAYQDGSTYYGEVVNGQPADGQGTMTYPSGNRYDGEYQNGQREGCGTFSFSDGRRYVGQFKADQFNGLGTWILENGERYIGEFENNQCDGQGSFIYANGTVRAGVWRDGTLTESSLSCEWGSLRVPTSSDN